VRHALRFVVAAVAALLAAAPAVAQIPFLLEVADDALDPDRTTLRAERRALYTRLSNLQLRAQLFNAACASVEKDSDEARRCQQQQAELNALRVSYIADANAFNTRVGSVARDWKGCAVSDRRFSGKHRRFVCGGADESSTAPPVQAVVVNVTGEVMLYGKDGQPVRPEYIKAGRVVMIHQIKTSANGRLTISLPDRSTLTVPPDSNVVLDEYWYDAPNTAGKMAAQVLVGVFRFATGQVKDAHPEIHTPAGVLGFRGTDVMVEALAGNRTAIWMVAGTVDFTPAGGGVSVPIRTGERAEIDANGELLSRTSEGVSTFNQRWDMKVKQARD
jgi:hypothetical protein